MNTDTQKVPMVRTIRFGTASDSISVPCWYEGYQFPLSHSTLGNVATLDIVSEEDVPEFELVPNHVEGEKVSFTGSVSLRNVVKWLAPPRSMNPLKNLAWNIGTKLLHMSRGGRRILGEGTTPRDGASLSEICNWNELDSGLESVSYTHLTLPTTPYV